jgi:hypothetical protein
MRGNPIVSATPDGKMTVTANFPESGLRITRGSTDAVRILPDAQIQHIELASDGQTALVSCALDGSNYRIARVSLSGQTITNYSEQGEWNDFFPTQLDSKTILFWRSTRRSGDLFGGSNPAGFDVFAVDSATLKARQITSGDYFNVAPIVVVRTGGQAFFRAFDTVYQLDLKTGATKKFPGTNVEITPVCASLGTRFIAIGNTPGQFDYDLYEIDSVDGSSKRLTKGWGYIESATFASETAEVIAIVGHRDRSIRRVRLENE